MSRTTSWWMTLPGVLTAIATAITAISGLVLALHKAGLWSDKSKQAEQPVASGVPHPTNCRSALQMNVKSRDGAQGDGYYEIWSSGGESREYIFCDMSSSGGGWARVGHEVRTCGRDKYMETDLLNRQRMPYLAIKSTWIRGATWCSGERATEGWGCSYNYAILKESGKYLYDGRTDSKMNSCRGCNFKEFLWESPSRRSDPFKIVDPENYEKSESIVDNGCSAEGLVFDVWIR